MFVIQNSEGELLLYKRYRQPFIRQWSLPNGKVHISDRSLQDSAKRELSEKLRLKDQKFTHAGECYIRTIADGEVVMSTLVHIFRFERDDIPMNERMVWVKPHKLAEYDLAPAVEQIVARTFFRDPYFFEEFEEAW